jgi:hypothetical protein
MQDGIGAGTYVHTGGTWVYGDTRRRHGLTIQVLCDIPSRVVGVSGGFPRSWHDSHCFAVNRLTKVSVSK